MKLKEKLAEDYSHKHRCLNNYCDQCALEGYIAGFEKAREMASGECMKQYHTMGGDIVVEIESLGEEQVDA